MPFWMMTLQDFMVMRR
ncbi:hypothetical protein ACHAW6_010001 [Cyclotella cf. meneghiniana]